MRSRDGRKLRILLVMNRFGWAGAETQLAHLARDLRASGHTVRVVSMTGRTDEPSVWDGTGVELLSMGARGRWSKLRAVRRLVPHARWADLVHCTGWDATLWGRIGGILARRPVLFTEHTPGRELQITPDGTSRQRAIALHNRLLERFTYAAIVVGAWQADLLVGEGVRRESIIHIPNGVPIEELRRRAQDGPSRAELGIPEDAHLVVQVARFSLQKGQSSTLAAVARLRERLGDVRLIFVGEGPEEARVKAEAEALGAEWVQFLGRRTDAPRFFELADLTVLPSTGEGLPMSLIESIALGTPVVATDVGDVSWLLARTGAGICVVPGDDAGFEAACERVLDDAETKARLTSAAAEGIMEFDVRVMTERYEFVFEAAVRGAPLPLRLPPIGSRLAPLA
jgi:glycosyltransferase involved in cell wall biosynthesis